MRAAEDMKEKQNVAFIICDIHGIAKMSTDMY